MRLKVDKARKKEQIASGLDKLSCVMCMVVFVGGLLDARSAQVTGESKNFEGPLERKKNEPSEPRSDRNEQSDENCCSSSFSRSKKCFFVQNMSGRF